MSAIRIDIIFCGYSYVGGRKSGNPPVATDYWRDWQGLQGSARRGRCQPAYRASGMAGSGK